MNPKTEVTNNKVKCVICDKYFSRITRAHLTASHNGMTVNAYLNLPNSKLRSNLLKEAKCATCRMTICRQNVRKKNYCPNCLRDRKNQRSRNYRLENESLSKQKTKARYYLTLSESEMLLIGQEGTFEGIKGVLDNNHKEWDFVPCSCGNFDKHAGHCLLKDEIGTVKEANLDTIQINGITRIKEAVELGKKLKKHKKQEERRKYIKRSG